MIIANIEDYRKQCEARLPRFLYDYISGGSFQENSLRANIAELQATLLRQRVMVDELRRICAIKLWDESLSLPVVLGPVGMAGMYSSRGEVKAAKAAKAFGIPFTLSPLGVFDVHEVARKTGTPPWFQLYMLKDRGFVKSVIERSVSAGSKVLVFTVDLATLKPALLLLGSSPSSASENTHATMNACAVSLWVAADQWLRSSGSAL